MESTPDGEETVPSSVEEVSGSVAEEYGIAPSAFGSETPEFPAAESLDHGVFGKLVHPQADPVCIAEPDGLPPGGDAQFGSARVATATIVGANGLPPRGIANASQGRGSDPSSLRRRVQSRPGLADRRQVFVPIGRSACDKRPVVPSVEPTTSSAPGAPDRHRADRLERKSRNYLEGRHRKGRPFRFSRWDFPGSIPSPRPTVPGDFRDRPIQDAEPSCFFPGCEG